MIETNDEWTIARRYMAMESLARIINNDILRLPAVADA
jgi:putative transposase